MALDITPLFPNQGDGSNATSIQGDPVSAAQPTDGQVLVFDEATQQYVPADQSGGATATPTSPGPVPGLGGVLVAENAITLAQLNSHRQILLRYTSNYFGSAVSNGTVTFSEKYVVVSANAGANGASAICRTGSVLAVENLKDINFGAGWFDSSWRIDLSIYLRNISTATHRWRVFTGTNSKAAGTLAEKGMGFEFLLNGSNLEVYAVAHNGTTYASELVATLTGSWSFKMHRFAIIKNGTQMRVEVDGTQYTTALSNLPTGNAGVNALHFEAQDTANPSVITDFFPANDARILLAA